jgi:hypothetical protein
MIKGGNPTGSYYDKWKRKFKNTENEYLSKLAAPKKGHYKASEKQASQIKFHLLRS